MTGTSPVPRRCRKLSVSARLGDLGAIEHLSKISIFRPITDPQDHFPLILQEAPKSAHQIFDLFDLATLPASEGSCASYFTHKCSTLSGTRVASLRSGRPGQRERQVKSERWCLIWQFFIGYPLREIVILGSELFPYVLA